MTTPVATVLIVDDNPSDIDFVQEAFAELSLGSEFLVAKDGVEAIALLQRVIANEVARPSVILLDLNMPRVGGLEVLAFIKGASEARAIPTVILTSSSSPKDRADCLAAGADAYLTKPRTLEQLNALVMQIDAMIKPRADRPGLQ